MNELSSCFGFGSLVLGIGIRGEHFTRDVQLKRHIDTGNLDRYGFIERTHCLRVETGRDLVILALLDSAFGLYGCRTATGRHRGLDDHRRTADIRKYKIMDYRSALLDLPKIIRKLFELHYIFCLLLLCALGKNTYG